MLRKAVRSSMTNKCPFCVDILVIASSTIDVRSFIGELKIKKLYIQSLLSKKVKSHSVLQGLSPIPKMKKIHSFLQFFPTLAPKIFESPPSDQLPVKSFGAKKLPKNNSNGLKMPSILDF